MVFTDEQKLLINNDSTQKQLHITFPNNTDIVEITNDRIYQEEMSLEESLIDQDNIQFGKCNGALFTVKVADFVDNIEGARIDVSITFSNSLRPGIDIDIFITGLRPGEKLYEELLVDHKNNTHLKTEHSRIFIEKQNGISYDSLDFKYVEEHFENLDNEHIKKMVARVIDTYDINGNGN